MKKRFNPTQCLPLKITAFILTVAMLVVSVLSVAGVVGMLSQDMYVMSEEEYLEQTYYNKAETYCHIILESLNLEHEQQHDAEYNCIQNNITYIKFTDVNTNKTVWEWKDVRVVVKQNADNYRYNIEYIPYWYYEENGDNTEENFTALSAEITLSDMNCEVDEKIIGIAYDMRYKIFAIGCIAIIASIIGFVFLMISSGRRKGYEEVVSGWGTKIPIDITTGVTVFAVVIVLLFCGEIYFESWEIIPILILLGVILATIFLAWSMSFALRIKLGKWWKNTVIYKAFALLWKFAKFMLKNIPLIWKAVLGIVGVIVIELFLMVASWNDYEAMTVLWLCSSVILGGFAFYCAIAFVKLCKAGEALANGNLSYQVDTSKLVGDFRHHAESLNSIAHGMAIAIDERVRSERMKTELITNVSHDIKTPLTSIINYTDLISKEDCDNEKITDYSQVLLRQSERLKRLIEDLVEASKASTGNLEVLLEPCDVNILLTQTAGEYEEKLSEKNLEIITAQPETPVIIMADGRRLWRVFDNLMNNICKYAQSFTRVYLTLERTGSEAVITFRNTSHSQLNISPDELMERFVRGDSSRNTEGNGLGLSIAKSLTELQNGRLELSIDGDLFKVTLIFPIIK